MNRYIILFSMMVAMAFSSCKDNDTLDSQDPIEGKWFVKKTISSLYEGPTKKEEDIKTDFDSTNFLEIRPDGTGTLSDSGDTDALTYTKNGNVLSLSDESGESTDFTIRHLTPSELVLVLAEEFTVGNSNVVHKTVEEIYFTK